MKKGVRFELHGALLTFNHSGVSVVCVCILGLHRSLRMASLVRLALYDLRVSLFGSVGVCVWCCMFELEQQTTTNRNDNNKPHHTTSNNTQRTTNNEQRTTYTIQPTTYNNQHTTNYKQHQPQTNAQQTTTNLQHTTYNTQSYN